MTLRTSLLIEDNQNTLKLQLLNHLGRLLRDLRRQNVSGMRPTKLENNHGDAPTLHPVAGIGGTAKETAISAGHIGGPQVAEL